VNADRRRAARRALAPVAAALALAACSRPAAPGAFERPPAPVTVAEAVARDVPVYLDEIGRVVASESVRVRAQVSGTLLAVRFEDGADLRKGDVLFEIDPRPFRARLEGAEAARLAAEAALLRARTATQGPEAALAGARATAALARSELTRAEGLADTKAISAADLDAKRGSLAVADAGVGRAEADLRKSQPDEKQAEADLKRAEADVAAARVDLEYATVRSPVDGRAGHRLLDAGNVVGPESGPLVRIERLDPVYADFSVAEARLDVVRKAMARGALRVEVRIPGDGGEPLAGSLTFLDNAVDGASGTVKLRATLPNPDRRLWSGQFVRVRLVLETLPGAVLVPASAPMTSATGTFVYVVKDDGTAEMRPAAVGQGQGDLVVLREGVKAGERVVVAGQLSVTPGGPVRVEAPAGAPR
jgi:multidrug efflux system membrane fusion protein